MHNETTCIDKEFFGQYQQIENKNNPSPNAGEREHKNEIELIEKFGPLFQAEQSKSDELGMKLLADGCNFSIWAESARAVDICIFEQDDPSQSVCRFRLNKSDKFTDNIFGGFIPNMKPGTVYGLRVDHTNEDQNHDYSELLIDPYARAIIGEYDSEKRNKPQIKHSNSDIIFDISDLDTAPYRPRSVVVDEYYDWNDDKLPNIPKTESIIYEAHVKGSTKLNYEIAENERGTFAGIASEPFLNHLKKLGITTLELMPVQQFTSEPHLQSKNMKNYWGYNTLGFFAPHNEYSSSGDRGEQVREFKDMVKKLHANNIEIVIDVVYNHTPEGSELGPTISFKGLDEKSIYHLSEHGKHCNYSGCGNTINASTEKGMHFILESLRYWAEEMHVDGFRFDLAPILAREQNGAVNMSGKFMNALRSDPVLGKLKLIAEPWDCSENKRGEFGENWQEWNDEFRDVVRDFWRGRGHLGRLATQLAAGGLGANKTINFVTAHDGFTLNDLVTYDCKHNESNGEDNRDGTDNNRSCNFGHEGPTNELSIKECRNRTMRNILLTLCMSSGTPMFSHGDEIMRTQNGNNNAYCQDNELTWLNWDTNEEQQKLYEFISKLIDFRKKTPALTKPNGYTGKPIDTPESELDVAWFKSDGNQFEYNDTAWDNQNVMGMFIAGEKGERLMYYANGTPNDQIVRLPISEPYSGKYEIIIDTHKGEVCDQEGIIINSDIISIKALSSIILKRQSETANTKTINPDEQIG